MAPRTDLLGAVLVLTNDNLYLLTALPMLGEFGSSPPLTLPALVARVADSTAEKLVSTLLWADDLLRREAVLAGVETERGEGAVFTSAQIDGREPLPDVLVARKPQTELRLASDLVWQCYYRHLEQLASRLGSPLLSEWVRFEVGLRNELARLRASELELDPGPYLVAPDLGVLEPEMAVLLHEWSVAPDPLVGTLLLDEARWRWLDDRDPTYSFSNDELVVYALRLLLLARHARLDQRGEPARHPGDASPHTPSQSQKTFEG